MAYYASGKNSRAVYRLVMDKFGLSWQIIPRVLGDFLSNADRVKSNRAQAAMMQMKKLDIKKLQDAFDGK